MKYFLFILLLLTACTSTFRYSQMDIDGEVITGRFYVTDNGTELNIWDESDNDMPFIILWKRSDGLWYHDSIPYETSYDQYQWWLTTTDRDAPNIILSNKIFD